MKTLAFTPLAIADIEDIWDYSAETWGPDQADRYTDEIRDACHALAAGWRTGRLVDIMPGYLKYTTGSHIIYFKAQMDRLEVIRILHNKQDVERHLTTAG
jgi:toxin ParE1/3/4